MIDYLFTAARSSWPTTWTAKIYYLIQVWPKVYSVLLLWLGWLYNRCFKGIAAVWAPCSWRWITIQDRNTIPYKTGLQFCTRQGYNSEKRQDYNSVIFSWNDRSLNMGRRPYIVWSV